MYSIKKIVWPIIPAVPVSQTNELSYLATLLALRAKIDECIDVINNLGLQPVDEWGAEAFSTEASYSYGDYVTKGGLFYKATEDIQPGPWDESKWVQVTIFEVMSANEAYASLTNELANGAYGESGVITILPNQWQDNEVTRTFTGLGNNDGIQFYPASRVDKDVLTAADVFTTVSGNVVTFECTSVPSENLSLIYQIVRNKED